MTKTVKICASWILNGKTYWGNIILGGKELCFRDSGWEWVCQRVGNQAIFDWKCIFYVGKPRINVHWMRGPLDGEWNWGTSIKRILDVGWWIWERMWCPNLGKQTERTLGSWGRIWCQQNIIKPLPRTFFPIEGLIRRTPVVSAIYMRWRFGVVRKRQAFGAEVISGATREAFSGSNLLRLI